MPSKKKKKDNHSKERMEYRRGKSKLRHKFTKDELKRLQQEFEWTSYSDFSTKDELAQQFRCQVCMIDNWFQNKKRARSPPELKDISAIRRMHKCQDYMLTGHQDTQVQASNCNPGQISSTQVAPGGLALYFMHSKKASGEQYGSCDSVIQIIGTRSSGTVEYLGATRSGSSFNFTPTNFILPSVSEQYYVGDQPETQESQYSTFSLAHYVPCMQGQRQMGCNYFPMFPGQQQNNWEYQQQK